jgi:carbon-monoxide dehydrogenase small subunit
MSTSVPSGDLGAAGSGESSTVTYRLRVNERDHHIAEAWLGESLLWVLRERLGLPGAKNACEQGECGSCSVLLDGDLVCACLVLAAGAVDATITTVEGIAAADPHAVPGGLSSVQHAFVDAGAVQCGFCTPGLVVAVHDLIDRNPDPTDLEIREAISGNLCRCTGYGRIFEAVREAAAARRSTVGGAAS